MLLTLSCMHQPTRAFQGLILWFLIVVVTPPSLPEAASGWFIHRWFLSFSYVLISVCSHLLWSTQTFFLCLFVCLFSKINKIIFPDCSQITDYLFRVLECLMHSAGFGPLHNAFFCINSFVRNYFSMTHFLILIGSDILHKTHVSPCRNYGLFLALHWDTNVIVTFTVLL